MRYDVRKIIDILNQEEDPFPCVVSGVYCQSKVRWSEWWFGDSWQSNKDDNDENLRNTSDR